MRRVILGFLLIVIPIGVSAQSIHDIRIIGSMTYVPSDLPQNLRELWNAKPGIGAGVETWFTKSIGVELFAGLNRYTPSMTAIKRRYPPFGLLVVGLNGWAKGHGGRINNFNLMSDFLINTMPGPHRIHLCIVAGAGMLKWHTGAMAVEWGYSYNTTETTDSYSTTRFPEVNETAFSLNAGLSFRVDLFANLGFLAEVRYQHGFVKGHDYALVPLNSGLYYKF